jgi:hypothetical protein
MPVDDLRTIADIIAIGRYVRTAEPLDPVGKVLNLPIVLQGSGYP